MLTSSFKGIIQFLNSDAKKAKVRNVSYFVLFFWISLGSFLISYRMLARFPGATIFNTYPLFGEYIKNIVQENKYYGVCDNVSLCYAGRLPFIPYFMAAIAWIHNSIPFAVLVKNVIIGFLVIGVIKSIIYHHKTKLYLVLLILFCFFIPSNMITLLDINHEEGYAWVLMLSFFSLLIYSIRYQEKLANVIVMGFLLGALTLIKSSYVYFVIAISIYLAIIFKSKIHKLIPLGIVTSFLLLWGTFIYSQTGHFAVLKNMSSLNGINLYRGNNEYTLEYYPKYHIDTLNAEKLFVLYKDIDFSNNEWQQNNYFNDKAKSFMSAFPSQTLELAWRKFVIFFFEIRKVTIKKSIVEHIEKTSVVRGTANNILYVSCWLINRLVLWSALLVSAYYTFFRQSNSFAWKRKISIAYLCLVTFYALPCIAGYAFYRHVIPLIPLSTIFLIWLLLEKDTDRAKQKFT